jgi:hypothetical protein
MDRHATLWGQRVLLAVAGLLAITLFLPLNANSQADPAAPCCGIAAIDARSGVVTGKVTATGRTFQFKVTDAKLLASLKVGQAVAADFTSGKVTVRPAGVDPINGVIIRPAEPVGRAARPAEPVGARIYGAEPVGARISGVDAANRTVTLTTTRGQTVRLRLNSVTPINDFKPGQGVTLSVDTAGKATIRVAGAEPVGATLLP